MEERRPSSSIQTEPSSEQRKLSTSTTVRNSHPAYREIISLDRALAGLKDRKTPLLIGVGTFQQTPYGAFVLNAFVDAGASKGSLLEATYMAEIKLGSLSLYPMLGIERRSAKYANYLYGVTAAESLASGYAVYNASSSVIPVVGLAADYSLTENWVVNMQLRRKWLDSNVTNSPLVGRQTQGMGYVGLSYRFK